MKLKRPTKLLLTLSLFGLLSTANAHDGNDSAEAIHACVSHFGTVRLVDVSRGQECLRWG